MFTFLGQILPLYSTIHKVMAHRDEMLIAMRGRGAKWNLPPFSQKGGLSQGAYYLRQIKNSGHHNMPKTIQKHHKLIMTVANALLQQIL